MHGCKTALRTERTHAHSCGHSLTMLLGTLRTGFFLSNHVPSDSPVHCVGVTCRSASGVVVLLSSAALRGLRSAPPSVFSQQAVPFFIDSLIVLGGARGLVGQPICNAIFRNRRTLIETVSPHRYHNGSALTSQRYRADLACNNKEWKKCFQLFSRAVSVIV